MPVMIQNNDRVVGRNEDIVRVSRVESDMVMHPACVKIGYAGPRNLHQYGPNPKNWRYIAEIHTSLFESQE